MLLIVLVRPPLKYLVFPLCFHDLLCLFCSPVISSSLVCNVISCHFDRFPPNSVLFIPFPTQSRPDSAFFKSAPQLSPLSTQPGFVSTQNFVSPTQPLPNSAPSQLGHFSKNQKDTLNSVLGDLLQSFSPNRGLRPQPSPS